MYKGRTCWWKTHWCHESGLSHQGVTFTSQSKCTFTIEQGAPFITRFVRFSTLYFSVVNPVSLSLWNETWWKNKKLVKSELLKEVFTWVLREIRICFGYRVCIYTLSQRFRPIAPLSQPIRSKTLTIRNLFALFAISQTDRVIILVLVLYHSTEQQQIKFTAWRFCCEEG